MLSNLRVDSSLYHSLCGCVDYVRDSRGALRSAVRDYEEDVFSFLDTLCSAAPGGVVELGSSCGDVAGEEGVQVDERNHGVVRIWYDGDGQYAFEFETGDVVSYDDLDFSVVSDLLDWLVAVCRRQLSDSVRDSGSDSVVFLKR